MVRCLGLWRYIHRLTRRIYKLKENRQSEPEFCQSSRVRTFQNKGWRSTESIRPLPMWPGFKSQLRHYLWVEFVIGSLLYSERFLSGFSGFPLSWKTTISKCVLQKISFFSPPPPPPPPPRYGGHFYFRPPPNLWNFHSRGCLSNPVYSLMLHYPIMRNLIVSAIKWEKKSFFSC